MIFFCQVELVNLSLLPEEDNGGQLQGFQLGEAKEIEVIFIFDFMILDRQNGRETVCIHKEIQDVSTKR